MLRIESAGAIQPYLNPEYWDGHSIGYGEPTGEWPDRPNVGSRLRDAKKALQTRVAFMHKVVPIETYGEGQAFDVNTYNEGTLVLLREEFLMGHADNIDGDVETLIGGYLPDRSYDVSPSFGNTNTAIRVVDSGIRYASSTRWGVVSLAKNEEKVLCTVRTDFVNKTGPGKVWVASANLTARSGQIEIGEVGHYKGRTGADRLERVNILDVVAHGEAKKERSALGRFVANLSLGHNAVT